MMSSVSPANCCSVCLGVAKWLLCNFKPQDSKDMVLFMLNENSNIDQDKETHHSQAIR